MGMKTVVKAMMPSTPSMGATSTYDAQQPRNRKERRAKVAQLRAAEQRVNKRIKVLEDRERQPPK